MISVLLSKAFPLPLTHAKLKRIVKYVCRKENIHNAELSFVIINSGMMKAMNKKFLRHNFVTDIITFPLDTEKIQAEIYINGERLKQQAKENGVSAANELLRLIVHGTLHAAGYDDKKPTNRKKMLYVQERYVEHLSLRK